MSQWAGAVGAWAPLARLLDTVQRELGIPPDRAASRLRPDLETGRISTIVMAPRSPYGQPIGLPPDSVEWAMSGSDFRLTRRGSCAIPSCGNTWIGPPAPSPGMRSACGGNACAMC
jgi:hypothetical protein